MVCPHCHAELRIAERQGIEIDYCPQCRGVWLDRGELDKIIERSSTLESRVEPEDRVRKYPHNDDREYHRKKRRGFLGDLFDFD